MQIPVIKKIVEEYGLDELKEAEEALIEEEAPGIEVEGEDAGEQLTHIIAAIEIKEDMEKNGLPFPKALRNYTSRVRKSIG